MPFKSITWKSAISGATQVVVGASALSEPNPNLPAGWVKITDGLGHFWTLNPADAATMSTAMLAAGGPDGP